MIRPRGRRRRRASIRALATGLLVTIAVTACSPASGEGRTAVASLYPIAFAARRIAGPGWRVVDMTPPGAEAHDVELSADDRAVIGSADLILHLGELGFQPQVERAAAEAGDRAVPVADGGIFERTTEAGEPDPHVWLDPVRFRSIVDRISEALSDADPGHEAGYERRAEDLSDALGRLHDDYDGSLTDCRYRMLIVPHEAFGYLAERYDIDQFGLAGLAPEAEPTADRTGQAGTLLAQGNAGAVFYEPDHESERIARSVAADAGVPALPLATLESEPPEGDYLSVMRRNLESLRQGLACR